MDVDVAALLLPIFPRVQSLRRSYIHFSPTIRFDLYEAPRTSRDRSRRLPAKAQPYRRPRFGAHKKLNLAVKACSVGKTQCLTVLHYQARVVRSLMETTIHELVAHAPWHCWADGLNMMSPSTPTANGSTMVAPHIMQVKQPAGTVVVFGNLRVRETRDINGSGLHDACIRGTAHAPARVAPRHLQGRGPHGESKNAKHMMLNKGSWIRVDPWRPCNTHGIKTKCLPCVLYTFASFPSTTITTSGNQHILNIPPIFEQRRQKIHSHITYHVAVMSCRRSRSLSRFKQYRSRASHHWTRPWHQGQMAEWVAFGCTTGDTSCWVTDPGSQPVSAGSISKSYTIAALTLLLGLAVHGRVGCPLGSRSFAMAHLPSDMCFSILLFRVKPLLQRLHSTLLDPLLSRRWRL